MVEAFKAADAAFPSVSAVLVTYNRKAYLEDCIARILAQDVKVEKLIIVDNASTDGTEDEIRRLGYLDHPRVLYKRMPENTGGSGGFSHGIMEAMTGTASEWFWVMDDDVAPVDGCLRTLIGYRAISECIHPLVVFEDGSEYEWEHLIDPGSTYQIGLNNRSFKNGKDWCSMNTACFEGMLVSRRIVDRIGPPNKDFFVYGDDNHFGYMASIHTNVIYVKNAKLLKKIKPGKDHNQFKVYYDIRNRFLLRRLMHPYYKHNSYSGPGFALFIVLHTANFISRPFRFGKLKAAAYAWIDGIRGVTGRHRY